MSSTYILTPCACIQYHKKFNLPALLSPETRGGAPSKNAVSQSSPFSLSVELQNLSTLPYQPRRNPSSLPLCTYLGSCIEEVVSMDYSKLPTPPACVADFCLIPVSLEPPSTSAASWQSFPTPCVVFKVQLTNWLVNRLEHRQRVWVMRLLPFVSFRRRTLLPFPHSRSSGVTVTVQETLSINIIEERIS